MRYHVIDCTKASGTTYTTRFAVVAVTVARWATMLTGRMHDVVEGGQVGKWYKQGRKDCLQGLPKDPPWGHGHRDHMSYLDGWEDGQRELDGEAERDDGG